MTFVKSQRIEGQGGHHRWGGRFAAAQKRYQEMQERKALAKMSPDERLKTKLTKELEETEFRLSVADSKVSQCHLAMESILDKLKELAGRYNLRVENGLIESYEVSSHQEAQYVRETFDSLKSQSTLYTKEFNQILSERGGLIDRVLELKLELLQVNTRIQESLVVQ